MADIFRNILASWTEQDREAIEIIQDLIKAEDCPHPNAATIPTNGGVRPLRGKYVADYM